MELEIEIVSNIAETAPAEVAVELLSQMPEACRMAVDVMARELVRLQEVVNSQGELLRAIDSRIKLLTALVDHHHNHFISKGWAKPRPASEGSLVN